MTDGHARARVPVHTHTHTDGGNTQASDHAGAARRSRPRAALGLDIAQVERVAPSPCSNRSTLARWDLAHSLTCTMNSSCITDAITKTKKGSTSGPSARKGLGVIALRRTLPPSAIDAAGLRTSLLARAVHAVMKYRAHALTAGAARRRQGEPPGRQHRGRPSRHPAPCRPRRAAESPWDPTACAS